jgi:hypothetical protein
MRIQRVDMKSAALVIVLSLAIVTQASAILRPRFPAKPRPPFRGQIIVIEDDSIQSPRK